MTDPNLPAPLVPTEVDLRTAAATRGDARYVDGNPCVHGHAGERYTRNAFCVQCQRDVTRATKLKFRRLMESAA